MMNFRDKNDALPSALLVAALLVAIGTVLYIALVPVPTTSPIAINDANKMKDDKATINRTEGALTDKLNFIRAYAFGGQEQDVDSSTLALTTKLSQNRNLKLIAFRPQKPVDAGQLTQLPYVVSVSGKFPDVVAFTSDLEAKGTKLAVNTAQIAASDTSTDAVTANINLVAYLNLPYTNGVQNG